ncbi:hypothetical protein [Beijerinckia mobilis]|uniref:hypothetical protein n=1 Tax=Beijerinckia mobilis TaxID=231434 RepID=UPI000555C0D3|nr:hypothetical protein [Beijerinckia mobilis]
MALRTRQAVEWIQGKTITGKVIFGVSFCIQKNSTLAERPQCASLICEANKPLSICRLIVIVYFLVCIASLALIPLNAVGAFGMDPDPLSALFATLLSMPWSIPALSLLGGDNLLSNLVITGCCMVANLAVLVLACRYLNRAVG